jgi:hypothetical protein
MSEALVCGFGGLAEGLAGLAWDLGEPGALLLAGGEANPGTFAIEEGGDAATLEIDAGGSTVECTLSPRSAPLALSSAAGSLTISLCEAEADLAGSERTVACPGQIGRWSRDPREGAGTFRQIAVEAGEDAVLVVTAFGEAGAAGHGQEATSAWRLEGESEVPFEEALISTQYDGAGMPTRFGLELWPQEADQSNRAGATRVSASPLGGAGAGDVWAGVFRCHTDGTEGLATYLLWRA